jgi:hypothetical protein
MKEIIRQEKEEERGCMWIRMGTPPMDPDTPPTRVGGVEEERGEPPTEGEASKPKPPSCSLLKGKPKAVLKVPLRPNNTHLDPHDLKSNPKDPQWIARMSRKRAGGYPQMSGKQAFPLPSR